MTEDNLYKGNLTIHIDNAECQCEVCNKKKDRYVRVVDMDKFVDNLYDWD